MRNRIYFFFILILTACAGELPKNNSSASGSTITSLVKYPLPKSEDSLLVLLKKLPDDTNKINVLNEIGLLEMNSNLDSSILIFKESLALAGKIYDPSGTSLISVNIANNIKANCYENLGMSYYQKADYPNSIDSYLKSLKLDEASNYKKGAATCMGNIGVIYYEQNDYSAALNYYTKALKIKKELGNKIGASHTMGNIGIVYMDQKNYPKALEFYFEALKIAQDINDKNGIASDIGNIGLIYFYEKKYPEALAYYQKAFELRKKIGNEKLIASSFGNMGALFVETGKYRDAYDYLYRAIAISDSIGVKAQLKSWYLPLSQLYEKSDAQLKDTIGGKLLTIEEMRLRALHYFKSYITLSDTLFSEENKKQLVRKEMNYEFEKKESTQKAEQEKKDILAKEELNQKEKERNYFIAGFALVILLAGFIFRSYRQKQKANEIISAQKLLVEEKQKEILDSIHYAKKIQQSLLPTEKYIGKNLTRLHNTEQN